MAGKHAYFAEITDTYGGDANYSWVTRHKVMANTQRGAVQKLSIASGLSWRRDWDDGTTTRYNSTSGATCVFISAFDPDQHDYANINVID